MAFYDKPLLKFDRLVETHAAYAPFGFASFRRAIPDWLRTRLDLPRELARRLGKRAARALVFCEHHESHAASAFYPSPFHEAAVLTLDGVGEWATATLAVGRGRQLRLLKEQRFPHSLGLLYSAFTEYLGFRVDSGEYKVMGLAPYGQPVYADRIRERLIDLKDDGSFRVDMRYFRYAHGLTMTSPAFHRAFDGPPRQPESALTRRAMDLAASIQQVTEEVDAPLRALRSSGDGSVPAVPGRRGGPQRRGGRPDCARGAVRGGVGAARRRRRGRRAGGRPAGVASAARERARPAGGRRPAGVVPGPAGSAGRRSAARSTTPG